jgi:hypothetical protein
MVAVLGVFALQARAVTVTFTIGNHPQANEENILLNTGTSGSTVTGVTNTSGLTVNFSSTTDTLSEPSQGQARVEALDGLLNNVTISVPGGSFTDLILNPFDGPVTGHPPVGSNATVTVAAGGGTFVYALANGQNFLTIVATSGVIGSVTIDAPAGFADLRQPRISGAAVVPLPAAAWSGLVLLGGLAAAKWKLASARRNQA